MQNCYSGMAARRLNAEGIEAFSSTSDSEVASYKGMGSKTSSYIEVYLDEVEKAANDSPHPSPREIFERARKHWVSIPEDDGGEFYSDVPWGPLDAKINQWCDDHQVSMPQNKNPIPENLKDIKKDSETYLQSEHLMGERRTTSGRCATQALKQFSQASAEIKAWLLKVPKTSGDIESRFADFDNYPHECIGSVEHMVERCLKWAKSHSREYPKFSHKLLEGLALNFERTIGNCPPPFGKFDDYKACYEKFWTSANDKDRLSLLSKHSRVTSGDQGSSPGASK